MSFQRLWDVYTTSYRRLIDAETTSCVYWDVAFSQNGFHHLLSNHLQNYLENMFIYVLYFYLTEYESKESENLKKVKLCNFRPHFWQHFTELSGRDLVIWYWVEDTWLKPYQFMCVISFHIIPLNVIAFSKFCRNGNLSNTNSFLSWFQPRMLKSSL